MKRLSVLAMCVIMLAACCCFAPASADGGWAPVLTNLTHNCKNTGKMLPEAFSSSQTCYILTVANWVNNVSLTPTAANGAYITINGKPIASGTASDYFKMTDEPQMVTIQVTLNGLTTGYTVFLQRRPSERRTRVSAGYIKQIYQNDNKFYIAADLVTVNYRSSNYTDGNRSTFTNDSSYLYRYAVNTHCEFYAWVNGVVQQVKDIYTFMNVYNQNPSAMYRIIYIEDEIVAVVPYAADY